MRDLLDFFDRPIDPQSIVALKVSLASPEQIKKWSHGEVKKAETINYRTLKPEPDGLFCAKIFGPIKDYECLCGKYKRMKHRGIKCEKCGVEVTQSKVRRERMGHIELATPVAHIWFFRSLPSRIGALLNITLKDLEKVLYCEAYIVTDSGATDLQEGEILSEQMYQMALEQYGYDAFECGIGAEVIRDMLAQIDLEELIADLRRELKTTKSEIEKKKISKRLHVAESFLASNNKPEWMVLETLPVLPPDLRPLVHLEGGRFAASDLNDLYRRVINRNTRLKRLMALNAPDIIIRNEKRMLQESVDALFDNGRRGRPFAANNKRPLRSLSDVIRGKQGRFRQNLLGKRVDYSGRSVIVVGPELKLHECGLPKKMALELFKPFIFNKLEERGYVTTIRSAKKMVEREKEEVWDVLAEVIREHPVMLNRAPTLHRLGIQAFEPILVEGKAIRLHPLVCTAFNADFDGDQMAVHVPLSIESQVEARVLMMSTNNILLPANGKPIIVPSQDVVLGIYYLTRTKPGAKGEGRAFSTVDEVILALSNHEVDIHASIKVKINGTYADTTVGRIMLYDIMPDSVPFETYNKTLKKGDLADLIYSSYKYAGNKATCILADRLMQLGFKYSTKSGISINIDYMIIPEEKKKILAEAEKKVQDVEEQYAEGLITDGERYNKIIDIWAEAGNQISEKMMDKISTEYVETPNGKEKITSFNPVYMMADSGARGSATQMRQLSGMRGLMAKPSGEIIETPITTNFREGLSVLEYFISTHGARKGLADTALKTANAGYLTRRLVDVAQDTVITEDDCGTTDGIYITDLMEGGEIIQRVGNRVLGRTVLEDVYDTYTGKLIVGAETIVDEEAAERINQSGVDKVKVRSVLTCNSKHGVCASCYGWDMALGRRVNIGEAVGVVAAQSIGEPGTQLTMRTFHVGGTAVKNIEQSQIEVRFDGIVRFDGVKFVETKDKSLVVMNRNASLSIIDDKGKVKESYQLVYGAKLLVHDGDKVKKGVVISEWDPYSVPIVADVNGYVKYDGLVEGISYSEQVDVISGLSRKVVVESSSAIPRITIVDEKGEKIVKEDGRVASYVIPVGANIMVDDGDKIIPGDVIAKLQRETSKTKDITGGLPRVAELFEARKPKKAAIISEVDGFVSSAGEVRGKRKILVTPEVGEPREYLIPKGRHVIVQDGDYIKAGEQIVDGAVSPHDILKVQGEKEVAEYLSKEIQDVYRLQGVSINDKHIEVIVKRMLSKVRILEPGDTRFLMGEDVDKLIFSVENERVAKEGGTPAVGEPILLGITKVSLGTDGFMSAASFQETTKILTESSIQSKVDYLRGLKENVMVGKRIPAGSGLDVYAETDFMVEGEIVDDKDKDTYNVETPNKDKPEFL